MGNLIGLLGITKKVANVEEEEEKVVEEKTLNKTTELVMTFAQAEELDNLKEEEYPKF